MNFKVGDVSSNPMYLLKTHVITDGRGDTVVIIKPLEAVMTMGGLVLREQGGDVGGVHHQHVPGQDLLLGHDVTTLGLGELHLKQEGKNRQLVKKSKNDKPRGLLTSEDISCWPRS